MEGATEEGKTQASVQNNLPSNVDPPRRGSVGSGVSSEGLNSQMVVFCELIKQVSPLRSEEPKEVLWFFARVDSLHKLKLVDDRVFLTKLMPLVTYGILSFLGECVDRDGSWEECKAQLVEEYFPFFVKERLIRDLIVGNFQRKETPVRAYIKQVFEVANFLGYEASEQQLVDRIVMNFHPDMLANAAFIDRPRSLKDLYRAVGLMEERGVAAEERKRQIGDTEQRQGEKKRPDLVKCWACDQTGHIQRFCTQRTPEKGRPKEE
jgi:hypothetical protein